MMAHGHFEKNASALLRLRFIIMFGFSCIMIIDWGHSGAVSTTSHSKKVLGSGLVADWGFSCVDLHVLSISTDFSKLAIGIDASVNDCLCVSPATLATRPWRTLPFISSQI